MKALVSLFLAGLLFVGAITTSYAIDPETRCYEITAFDMLRLNLPRYDGKYVQVVGYLGLSLNSPVLYPSRDRGLLDDAVSGIGIEMGELYLDEVENVLPCLNSYVLIQGRVEFIDRLDAFYLNEIAFVQKIDLPTDLIEKDELSLPKSDVVVCFVRDDKNKGSQ